MNQNRFEGTMETSVPTGGQEEKWYLEPMTEIAAELNAQSGWTWAHSGRVGRYAVAFGKKLGLSEDQLMALQCAALLHDVGKVVVPPELLNKVSKLTRDEWYSITKHPMASAQIIKGSSLAVQIASIARSHHEWFSGEGYPIGLKGDAIPLGARILSLADACDAMSSDRPYRAALTPEQILEQIEKGAGSQFDPVLVTRLRQVLQSDLSHIFPHRLLRVVSNDPTLVQQLWFALYPHGWDLESAERNAGPSHEGNAATQAAVGPGIFAVTLIDGLSAGADQFAKSSANGPVIWLDGPNEINPGLQRPLDLASVLRKMQQFEAPSGKAESIKVLLADPYHLFRQALKQCLEENDDIEVVADVNSAIDFRRLRTRVKHDVAVVASDMLAGTYTTGSLRPDDIPLEEDEAMAPNAGGPPVIILVSDEDLEDPRLAAKIWQPGASISTDAYIYRGSPAEVLVEAVRTLTLAETQPGGWSRP
jgi:hypothetical protein